MPIEIDFDWSVDVKGYRLERGRVIGNRGPKRAMRLKDFPTLYLQFVRVQTPEALLDFANRFGRLTRDEVKEKGGQWQRVSEGDDVRKVLSDADIMSKAFEVLRGHMGNPPKWQGGPFGRIPLKAKLSVWIAPDPMTGAWQLRFTPPTLLDALWLQFGQAVVSNAVLKQCDHCGRWFEAGAGGRRRDAKFCSRECKANFHSLKRSR